MIYQGEQADDLSSPARAYAKICVIGAGSLGAALASVARLADCQTASRPIEGERRGLSTSLDHPIAVAAEAAE